MHFKLRLRELLNNNVGILVAMPPRMPEGGVRIRACGVLAVWSQCESRSTCVSCPLPRTQHTKP